MDVEQNGRVFHEMQVDGSAATQVCFYPPSLDLRGVAGEGQVKRHRTA